MHTEGSVEIDRPIDEVYQLTNDHVVDWSIIVVENEVLTETPNGVGSTFRTVTDDRGRRMEFAGVVTASDPPHRHAIEMKGEAFDLQVEYVFKSLPGNRTRVTQNSSVAAKGFFKVMLFLCGWMMKKSSCGALDKELQSLKRFCESHVAA